MNALLTFEECRQFASGCLLQGFSEERHERRDGQELFLLGEGQIGTRPEAIPSPLRIPIWPTSSIRRRSAPPHLPNIASAWAAWWILNSSRPDALTLDLNGFYSHFDATNFDTNFMASPLNELAAGISPTSYTVVNGTLEAATFPNTTFDPTTRGSAFPGVRDSIYRPKAASMSWVRRL